MNKNIYLALIGIGIGGIGFGLITPVTVMLLEQAGASSLITGSTTTVGYLSIIIFSRYTGRLIDRLGVKKVLLAGLIIWMLGAAAHIFWFIYPLLYPIKFIMGIGGTFIFVSTEVMINHYSNDSNRGKNIGLYVVLLSAGVAVGTLLIWTINIADWVPFVIGAMIMFVVLIFEYFILDDVRIKSSDDIPEKMPFSRMPVIGLLAGIVYGLFESSIIVALPMYGLRNLFRTDQVSIFLASFVIGGIVLLYVIGSIADKLSKHRLLLYISSLLAVLFLIPVAIKEFVTLIMTFFIMGGIVPAFYTVGLNYTVEQVDKRYMAQANGIFVMMYGIGTIAGPLIGSLTVELDKEYGYWIMASALCLLFYLYLIRKARSNA